MHLKFNDIQSLYEKYDMIKNKRSRIKNNFMKSLFDLFSNSMNIDIFNKFTAFENIENITKLLFSYIRILSKGEVKKYTEILSMFEFLVNLKIK